MSVELDLRTLAQRTQAAAHATPLEEVSKMDKHDAQLATTTSLPIVKL